jgi:putative Mg2+ transporter-C (MgtC) family protein
MTIAEMALRLGVAAVLGGVIGFERERHGRPAGFRTHILVSVGSALIMMVSLHIYEIFIRFQTANYASGVDPSRVASMVVAGIGFIGAGTIMQSRGSIWGLTTAACLWVSAGLGLAAGCGYYAPAIIATVISLLTLILLKRPIERLIRKDWYYQLDVEMEDSEEGLKRLRSILADYGACILKIDYRKDVSQKEILYMINIRLKNIMEYILISRISGLEGVRRVTTS